MATKGFGKTSSYKFIITVFLTSFVFLYQNCDSTPFEVNSSIEQSSKNQIPQTTTTSFAATESELCNRPPIDPNADQGIFIYLDCETDTLHVEVRAGGTGQAVFSGKIESDKNISQLSLEDMESNDSVAQPNSKSIDFELTVFDAYYDAFSFRSNEVALLTLSLDSSSNQNIFIGGSKKKVSSPVTFYSDGIGPKAVIESLCGEPTLDPSKDYGVFLYKNCNNNLYTAKILAGGSSQSIRFTGTISNEGGQFLSMTPLEWEANDSATMNGEQNQISFTANVQSPYADSIDFTTGSSDQIVLSLDEDAPVYFGSSKTPMGSSGTFNSQGEYIVPSITPAPTPTPPPSPTPTPTPIPKITTYQTLKPPLLALNQILRNPGKGFEQAGKIYNNGGFVYNNSVEASTDITYIRLPWDAIEGQGDNQFKWSVLDSAIENSVSRGKQVALSIISWRPQVDNLNYLEAMPSWYYQHTRHKRCTGINTPSGCTYYLVDYSGPQCSKDPSTCVTNRWAFNHDDPEFIKQQVELVQALRTRYDNPSWAAKLAYIDVRAIGSWSESHTTSVYVTGQSYRWPMPQWTNYKKILDEHLKFNYIPQIVNFDNDDKYKSSDGTHPYDYTCKQALNSGKTIGWRTDGIEATLWEINQIWAWSDSAKNCWKAGPVYAEAMDGAGVTKAVLTDSLQRLTDWNASGFNNKWTNLYPNDADYTNEINQWLAKAGYRLYVSDITIPSKVTSGTSFNVSTNLGNNGIAPMYRNFYELKVKFTPVNTGSEVIVSLPGNLKEVLPNSTVNFNGTGTLTKGQYNVSVGIIQDSAFGNNFPIQLANDSSICKKSGGQYWCSVGSTQVD